MGIRVLGRTAIAGFVVLALAACQDSLLSPPGALAKYGEGGGGGGGGGGGHETTAGNNLSFPVIWAEGATKALQGTAGVAPVLTGEWWWWWAVGDTFDVCAPNPTDDTVCLDLTAPGEDARKAYLQKDANNIWQAGTLAAPTAVSVSWVDWGDDLEAKDWTTKSMIRMEIVLYKDLADGTDFLPMTEYLMRHVSGLGTEEVWGISTFSDAVENGPGTQATVYSPCARLTMQELNVSRDDATLANLVWNADVGAWENPVPGEGEEPLDLVNEDAVMNQAVYEAADGPGYFNAEVNVKGKIIYGYTMNARSEGLAAGDYRLTFSLDASCGAYTRNTDFTGTQILLPVEEETETEGITVMAEEGSDTGGAVAYILPGYYLTYMDIRLTAKGGGGGGGGGGGPRR